MSNHKILNSRLSVIFIDSRFKIIHLRLWNFVNSALRITAFVSSKSTRLWCVQSQHLVQKDPNSLGSAADIEIITTLLKSRKKNNFRLPTYAFPKDTIIQLEKSLQCRKIQARWNNENKQKAIKIVLNVLFSVLPLTYRIDQPSVCWIGMQHYKITCLCNYHLGMSREGTDRVLKYMEIRENYSVSISHLCYRASRIFGKSGLRLEKLLLARPRMNTWTDRSVCERKFDLLF